MKWMITMMINAQARYLMSPSIFAMCPNICAKEFGIIPRSSGTIRTPSIVNVLPVPVCPYAKIVPGKIESKNNNSHQECKKKSEFHWACPSGKQLSHVACQEPLAQQENLFVWTTRQIFVPCSHHHAFPYNNSLWVFIA